MTIDTELQLQNIIGRTLKYKGSKLFFKDFKQISSGKIIIITATGSLSFYESEIPDFLNSLEEVEEKLIPKITNIPESKMETTPAPAKQEPKEIYQPSAESKELKDTLMEALRNVKQNKEYIDQAKQLCNIASVMVQIQKQEFEMIKTFKR